MNSERSKSLISPDWLCRRYGCQDHPGLPQSNCYYCGKITSNAAEFCLDFRQPNAPRPFWQWVARQIDKYNGLPAPIAIKTTNPPQDQSRPE